VSARRAVVIGSGPNGLTAAVELRKAGLEVTVYEAARGVGGGARSAELTLPGFVHDVCSAVHPMAAGSAAFRSYPLEAHGLRWIQPPAPLAHPLDDGTAVLLERSVDATAAGLGEDGPRYRRLVSPLAARWEELSRDALAPPHLPRSPLLLARFGLLSAFSAAGELRALFKEERTRALLAGIAAHAIVPLERPFSGAVGWALTLAGHAVGWPVAAGGSQAIADALASYFRSLGGVIELGRPVRSLDELPAADLVMCDITPRQLLKLAGARLPEDYRARLSRFRYGPGVFKVDYALDGPAPWRAPECARAATVHLGGTLEEIALAERAPWEGKVADRPFVLVAQQSLFDPSRAPAGKQTLWAYCHVPHGSAADATEAIERQLERFAPGFRSRVLARRSMGTAELEHHNANLVGGDISGGAMTPGQLFLRPTAGLYRTPARGLYLCSASTPPGAGVHGLCGFFAAKAALKDLGTT
jgi:phytoene dehydrogenase-like protein